MPINRIADFLHLDRGGPTWWAAVACAIGFCVGVSVGLWIRTPTEAQVRRQIQDMETRIAEVRAR